MASTVATNTAKLVELSQLVDLQTKELQTLIQKVTERIEQVDKEITDIAELKEVLQNAIGGMESTAERVNLATEALIKIHRQAVETWASKQQQ